MFDVLLCCVPQIIGGDLVISFTTNKTYEALKGNRNISTGQTTFDHGVNEGFVVLSSLFLS